MHPKTAWPCVYREAYHAWECRKPQLHLLHQRAFQPDYGCMQVIVLLYGLPYSPPVGGESS